LRDLVAGGQIRVEVMLPVERGHVVYLRKQAFQLRSTFNSQDPRDPDLLCIRLE
jgi:hypothetical protein